MFLPNRVQSVRTSASSTFTAPRTGAVPAGTPTPHKEGTMKNTAKLALAIALA
jgi:hypothetical protein